MADTPDPTRPRREPKIADAAELFRDAEPERPAGSPPPRGVNASAPGGYELEEPFEVTAPPVMPLPTDQPAAAAREAPLRASSTAAAPAREGTVEQVWSRTAEWGPNVALLAIVGLIVLFLVYQTFSVDDMTLGFLILFAGIATLIVLSYPIVITLERPVRITPEQAVTDYFNALSHHLPHFRRMWLLLSKEGRTSSSYASYEGFKAYWRKRLDQLRNGRVGKLTPLVFKVDEFKSDKSAGKTSIDVKFTVNVHARGKQNEPPLASPKMSMTLVKGPDQMWYLNKGTLPGERV